jgi:YD repeat-containing protein
VVSLSAVAYTAHNPVSRSSPINAYPALLASYHTAEVVESSRRDDSGPGIKEDIPPKYQARYEQWKKEFLSTEAGREQWNFYQNNDHITLTITISRENAEGATTGKYKWNDDGQLTAATITLGSRLDDGYPNPIYFPVMNSLVPMELARKIDGSTLAATKLAHEFGHVNRTGKIDPKLYQLQAQLIPQYNKIFLSNGRNAQDPKLVDLAQQIGGTPVEIWEDREYWGEANAMLYLRDRVTDEGARCSLFNRIKNSVDLYAKSYEGRFFDVVKTSPKTKLCGWQ